MTRTLTAAMFLLPLLSCSTNVVPAQRAINSTARLLVEIDRAFAPIYEQARINARNNSNAWNERDKRMQDWDKVVDLIQACYRWIAATEAAIDTWESAGQDENFLRAAACLTTSLIELQAGFSEVGVASPPGLNNKISKLILMVPGQCE